MANKDQITIADVITAWPMGRNMTLDILVKCRMQFVKEGRSKENLRDWLRLAVPHPPIGYGKDLRAAERGEVSEEAQYRWCLAVLRS